MKIQESVLSSAQRERILRDIWIAHDGRWFLKSAGKLGFDVATQLNLAVTKSFGKTEIRRLLSEIGAIEIKCIEDLNELLLIAGDIYCPVDHEYEHSVIDKNNLSVKISQCYVYKNVSLAGTTDIHQCAGKQRFISWLEALNLKGTVANSKNTNDCNGTCEYIFNIQW
jgi:hypothetical protein